MSTPHLTAYGWSAEVVFPDEGGDRLVLAGASMFPPADLAAFWRLALAQAQADAAAACFAAGAAATDYPRLPEKVGAIPVGVVAKRLVAHADRAPASASARAAWLYLDELHSAADLARVRGAARRVYGRQAYRWEVWRTPAGVDLAFRPYGRDGTVVEAFDVDRQPAADVEAVLRGEELVAFLASF